MLNIPRYISQIPNHVVIKASESFPAFQCGHDFDIFVTDREKATQQLAQTFLENDADKYTLQVNSQSNHTHIDIIEHGTLLVRFDLIDSFTFLSKVTLSLSFPYQLYANREQRDVGGFCIYFPSKLDDLFLRYVEYLEYIAINETKAKHLTYIQKHATEIEWTKLCKYLHDNLRYSRELRHNIPPSLIRSKYELISVLKLCLNFIASKVIGKIKKWLSL